MAYPVLAAQTARNNDIGFFERYFPRPSEIDFSKRTARKGFIGYNLGSNFTLPGRVGSIGLIDFGRTVDICGRVSGVLMVAMIFPPIAGRILQQITSFGSISRLVQSAVRPVCNRMERYGITVLPVVVALARTISGR